MPPVCLQASLGPPPPRDDRDTPGLLAAHPGSTTGPRLWVPTLIQQRVMPVETKGHPWRSAFGWRPSGEVDWVASGLAVGGASCVFSY